MRLELRVNSVSLPTCAPLLPPTQEKPHKCRQQGCSRQFNRKYTLVEHMKTHTGEKPHICPVPSCRKRFSTSSNFSRHKRLHGIIKPLKCPVDGCYCTFPSDNKLHKHMQFHLGSPVRVCTIDNCGKTFSTTGNLNRHARHQHPNDRLRPIRTPQMDTPMPVQALQKQLHVDIPPQQQVPYPVDMRYQFPNPRVISLPTMDVVPSAFSPQHYDGAHWSGDFFRLDLSSSEVPSPIQGTRNLGIADVLSSIFDETEYAFTDAEKPLPAPLLQLQHLQDDMVDLYVAHIEL